MECHLVIMKPSLAFDRWQALSLLRMSLECRPLSPRQDSGTFDVVFQFLPVSL